MSASRTSPKVRHLLGLAELSKSELEIYLKRADMWRRILSKGNGRSLGQKRKSQVLINLFFEPSTRTRISFEFAGYRLGMNVINFATEESSLRKGETVQDTFHNLTAMRPSIIAVRVASTEALSAFASSSLIPIVNAGDGVGEHPTQALLDALTLLNVKKRLQGLKIAIIGDIAHSRVAHSNFHLLPKFGVKVFTFGPDELVPEILPKGVVRANSMSDALRDADAVMMLRIQLERMKDRPLPLHNYHAQFGLNSAKLAQAKPEVMVLHPGPMNRGLEIDNEVADDPKRSFILAQVSHGVAVRMAVLEILTR